MSVTERAGSSGQALSSDQGYCVVFLDKRLNSYTVFSPAECRELCELFRIACDYFIYDFYYMANSVSGQDEPNLAPVIGYLSGQDGAILPARDTGYVPQGKFVMFWCFIPYNKSFIDQACSVKMAGYWPSSFFAFLWNSTSSRSIKTQKKNLTNIQPS